MTTANALRCFVDGCEAQVVLTRSWRNGPTLHACAEHVSLLHASARAPVQKVLL